MTPEQVRNVVNLTILYPTNEPTILVDNIFPFIFNCNKISNFEKELEENNKYYKKIVILQLFQELIHIYKNLNYS